MSLIGGADFSSRGASFSENTAFGEYICKLTIEFLSLLSFRLSQKSKRKVQGNPQSQAAAHPRHEEEEETDKTKQAQIEQAYEKHNISSLFPKQTTTISRFERRNILIVFRLIVGIPIEVFGVNLNVTNQFVNIQIMLFLDISFDLLSQFLKLRSEFTIASLFCICMSFIPFSMFLLILDVIQGTEATDLLVLEGIYLSTASYIEEVIKLKKR